MALDILDILEISPPFSGAGGAGDSGGLGGSTRRRKRAAASLPTPWRMVGYDPDIQRTQKQREAEAAEQKRLQLAMMGRVADEDEELILLLM